MKELEWQLILFVGYTLAHEYWIFWGLPRIYYCKVKKLNVSKDDDDHNNRVA